MRLIKVGLANINTIVGAFDSNTAKVIEYARTMAKDRCTIGCFQEQVISGHPDTEIPESADKLAGFGFGKP